MEVVRVATVTVTEFLPYVKPEHQDQAAGIIGRFNREAFDTAAEAVATELIRKLRRDPARCAVCWGINKAGASCKGCGNMKTRAQRLNDIYIAATAATADGVRRLFTYDGGIHALAPSLPDLEILRPPSSLGELFDRLEVAHVVGGEADGSRGEGKPK